MLKGYLNMQRYIALLKVVEVGSFTKAAELLGYTQPALSQMIASLEKELSVKLLYRSRYGIRLTPEGERLYPPIRCAVTQYEAMRRKVDEVRGLDSGLVRIGTVSSVSCHWLPEIIKLFWQEHPNIRIELRQGDYTELQELVRTGAVDFGFTNPAAVKGMETIPVGSGEFRAVVPANHRLAAKPSVTLDELANEPFLLLEEGAYSEPLEAFRAEGLAPDIRLRVHDDYSILSMVERGLGVSILTELVLRRTDYCVAVLTIDPPVIRRLSLVIKDRDTIPAAAKAFIRCLMNNTDCLK